MSHEIQRPHARPRVMVVDDDEQIRNVIRLQLAAEGYDVELVGSGEQALSRFASDPPDLVLLDVMMPAMNGFAVCRMMRELPAGKDVAVVFLTALSDFDAHRQALACGADDFLTKPVSRVELLLRVRSLLRIKQLQDEQKHNYELIRTQRDALAEAQRQREAAISFVVHDLKNPLFIILLNAEQLADSEGLSSEQLEYAGDITKVSRRMHRMIMNLLDLSRSGDGAIQPEVSEVDVGELARELRDELGPRLSTKDQRLRLDGLPTGTLLRADRELCTRMIANLIENASKYSPEDSEITIEARAREPGWVELRVGDQGPGVPAADRERVFERYVRLHENTTHERPGLGLGLASCRAIARAHGGSIWIEDNRPRGAVFCVRMPGVSVHRQWLDSDAQSL